MTQIFALAAVAGLASAFLSGLMTPGTSLLVPLTFVAPAPLLVVGLGWHPLVAALGGLLGCIGLSLTFTSKVGLSFAVMVAIPAYLIAALIRWLMTAMPQDTPRRVAGRVFGTYVLGAIALYSALAMLVGALAVDTNFAAFEARIGAIFERMMLDFARGGPAEAPDAEALRRLSRMFVGIFVPMAAMLVATVLTFSLWISVRYLMRAERWPFARFPAHAVNLPREFVFALFGAALVSQSQGFLGAFGASLTLTLMFMLMLNGLALIHERTLGSSSRPLTLGLVWISLLIFAPAALVYSFAGLLDALFGFRRDGGNTPS